MSKCPFCNNNNIEFFPSFRHCKSCNRDFDFTDYNWKEREQLWKELIKELEK